MNSSAFVAAIPSTTRGFSLKSVTPFVSRQGAAAGAPKRARLVMMKEDKSIPQGFTRFSEELNGRAAMVGFFLALMTEALTGEGIVGQVGTAVKNVEHILPF